MYDFFYRMNTPLWYAIKIPSRYRIMITLSLGVLITSAWFYVIWQPLCASLMMYQQNIHAHVNEKHASTTMLDERILQVNERQQYYASVCQACAISSPLATITEIFDALERQGIIFWSYQPQGTTRHAWYTSHCFLFELKGSFSALHAFFKTIKEMRYMLSIDKVRMSKIDDEQVCVTCLFTLVEIPATTKEPHA